MDEQEICSDCGQPKPIKLVLRNERTGQDSLLCRECGNAWLDSDKQWPKQQSYSEPEHLHKKRPRYSTRINKLRLKSFEDT